MDKCIYKLINEGTANKKTTNPFAEDIAKKYEIKL